MKIILRSIKPQSSVLFAFLLTCTIMISCEDLSLDPANNSGYHDIESPASEQNPAGTQTTVWPLSKNTWFNPAADKDDPADAFGPRTLSGNYDFHQGMDFKAPQGKWVYAVASGIVKRRETGAVGSGLERFGKFIVIEHSENSGDLGDYQTAYLHLNNFKSGISVGDHVNKGQHIGYVGKTGVGINGDHLHLSLYERTDGIINRDYLRNPLKILNYDGGGQSGSAYYNVTVNKISSNSKISVTVTVPDHALDLNQIFIDPQGSSNARTINFETNAGMNSNIDNPYFNDVTIIADPNYDFNESKNTYQVRFRYQGSWSSTSFCTVKLKDTHGLEVYNVRHYF